MITKYCASSLWDYKNCHYKAETAQLLSASVKWLYLTGRIGLVAKNDKEMIGTSANDFLMYSGYVSLGYYWLRMMNEATKKLAENPDDAAFYQVRVGCN